MAIILVESRDPVYAGAAAMESLFKKTLERRADSLKRHPQAGDTVVQQMSANVVVRRHVPVHKCFAVLAIESASVASLRYELLGLASHRSGIGSVSLTTRLILHVCIFDSITRYLPRCAVRRAWGWMRTVRGPP